jgi:hypothetical protein
MELPTEIRAVCGEVSLGCLLVWVGLEGLGLWMWYEVDVRGEAIWVGGRGLGG